MSALDIFMQILGYAGAVGIAVFSSPELIRCIRTKKTSSVNVPLFILLMTSSACFFISGFYNISKTDPADTQFAFNLAVSVANVFSFLVPLTILTLKGLNVMKAKKLGITEKELEERRTNKTSSKQAQ